MLELLEHRYSKTPKVVLNRVFEGFGTNLSPESKCSQIKNLLTLLEDKKYLKWEVCIEIPGTGKCLSDDGFGTDFRKHFGSNLKGALNELNEVKVLGTLLPDGLDYAIEIKRKRTQHTISKISIFVSVASALIAFGSLYKTFVTQREFDTKLQLMQKTLQSQQDLLQTTTGRLNQLIERNAQDSSVTK